MKIQPSGRIDYCCECKTEHGYDCPKDVMTTNWIEEIKRKFGILRKVDISINRSDNMTEVSKKPEDELIDFITTLLEKQREEIQDKLNKHWDKLESLDEDKSTENWQRYKYIRNNNNDVINLIKNK